MPLTQKARRDNYRGGVLQWHRKQRLAPLFAQDGTRKHRRWSFANVLERRKAIRQERAKLNGVEFNPITTPEEDQQRILDSIAPIGNSGIKAGRFKNPHSRVAPIANELLAVNQQLTT